MGEDKTMQNLKAAFVGEAKACLRLAGFSEKAEEEGYPQMAHLFRAISAAEKVHALKHLRQLGIVKSTEENLQASFESETTVSENYYTEFIKTAEEEGNQTARIGFSHARDAEEFHAKLYKNALDHMLDERKTSYSVCSVCGYVHDGEPPENCPVCNAPKEKFDEIE